MYIIKICMLYELNKKASKQRRSKLPVVVITLDK